MLFFNDLIKRSDISKIRFVIMYCQEAHASDEWQIGSKYKINQHKTLEERIECAKLLMKDYQYSGEILIDSMNNSFQEIYSSWPTRYYLIHNNQIKYICEPKNATFTFDAIIDTLNKLLE
jgi:type I thyroxine 5'-deiodinase